MKCKKCNINEVPPHRMKKKDYICSKCSRKRGKAETKRIAARRRMWRRSKQWRLDAIKHYSNGELKCKHCGTGDIRVLVIDHINGGGNEQRRTLGNLVRGNKMYKWLKSSHYPEGYQVLCLNCNWVKWLEEDDQSHSTDISNSQQTSTRRGTPHAM